MSDVMPHGLLLWTLVFLVLSALVALVESLATQRRRTATDLLRRPDQAEEPDRMDEARAAHVSTATLERIAWRPNIAGDPPCGDCGGPRWAHRTKASYDGPCMVPECACRRENGGWGYQPSRPRKGTT